VSTVRSAVALRVATMADAEMLFRWRNDPFVMMRGSSQRPVTWEEHLPWFEATLTGNNRKVFIVMIDDQAAGQVRFDRANFDRANEDACTISVYLLEPYTGRGLGVEAIQRGCEMVLAEWPVERIVACVREENAAARAAFHKAGFERIDDSTVCGSGHRTFILRRQMCDPAKAVRP
jgi:RimJ/RimL family protein N-acetyltransferase